MEEAKTKVKPGAEIIYMGWIMAGKIKGYYDAEWFRACESRESEIHN